MPLFGGRLSPAPSRSRSAPRSLAERRGSAGRLADAVQARGDVVAVGRAVSSSPADEQHERRIEFARLHESSRVPAEDLPESGHARAQRTGVEISRVEPQQATPVGGHRPARRSQTSSSLPERLRAGPAARWAPQDRVVQRLRLTRGRHGFAHRRGAPGAAALQSQHHQRQPAQRASLATVADRAARHRPDPRRRARPPGPRRARVPSPRTRASTARRCRPPERIVTGVPRQPPESQPQAAPVFRGPASRSSRRPERGRGPVAGEGRAPREPALDRGARRGRRRSTSSRRAAACVRSLDAQLARATDLVEAGPQLDRRGEQRRERERRQPPAGAARATRVAPRPPPSRSRRATRWPAAHRIEQHELRGEQRQPRAARHPARGTRRQHGHRHPSAAEPSAAKDSSHSHQSFIHGDNLAACTCSLRVVAPGHGLDVERQRIDRVEQRDGEQQRAAAADHRARLAPAREPGGRPRDERRRHEQRGERIRRGEDRGRGVGRDQVRPATKSAVAPPSSSACGGARRSSVSRARRPLPRAPSSSSAAAVAAPAIQVDSQPVAPAQISASPATTPTSTKGRSPCSSTPSRDPTSRLGGMSATAATASRAGSELSAAAGSSPGPHR